MYVLAARPYADEELGPEVVALEDYVAVLSPAGELVEEIPLLGPIAASPHAHLLERARSLPAHRLYLATQGGGKEFDLLHTNHVEVLDGSLAAEEPRLRAGQHPVLPAQPPHDHGHRSPDAAGSSGPGAATSSPTRTTRP